MSFGLLYNYYHFFFQSEKMKHLLSSRYLSSTADPHAALARDVAIVGGVIGVEGNQIDQQVASLEALVTQQRKAQCRMTKVLRDAEIRHRAVRLFCCICCHYCNNAIYNINIVR